MTPYALPLLVTALLVLGLFGALLRYVLQIVDHLEAIGGTGTSYLAKLRLGLRAIETETGHLPGSVMALNRDLGDIAAGLEAVDGHLAGTLDAALKQEGGG